MGQDFLQNHVGVLVAEGQTRGRDGGAKAHPHERGSSVRAGTAGQGGKGRVPVKVQGAVVAYLGRSEIRSPRGRRLPNRGL